MPQRNFPSRNIFTQAIQKIHMRMTFWTVVVIMLLQQMKTIDGAKFKGDGCVTKNKPGVCKEWGECPVIKTLIESGQYTNREVVSCGFGVVEELICCPVIRETKIPDNTDRFTEPTTTQAPAKDFWLDLLQNTSSTTAAPDFWLDLLNPTTTTTLKPLIIGKQRLNESSEFFDLNALLSRKQHPIPPTNSPSHLDLQAVNGNSENNENLGPANTNQFNFDQTENKFHRSPPGFTNVNPASSNHFPVNNNGNLGWGQLNSNRGHNMGRGPHNNNGRGHNNGRGQQNNNRARNNMGLGNQNQGFVFSQNNAKQNNFFGEDNVSQRHRTGRPINNVQQENPNFPNTNNTEEKNIDELIKHVFNTQTSTNGPSSGISNIHNPEKPTGMTIEDNIAQVFNVNRPETHASNSAQQVNNPLPADWHNSQKHPNNHDIEFIDIKAPHNQMELTNPHAPGHFVIIPVVGTQIGANNLHEAPSTSFIQQPVVVESWSGNPGHTQDFNPVQAVYENSGMDIVKVEDNHVESAFNTHQQQFGQPPVQQIVVLQPQQQMHQFVQQSEFIYQPAVQQFPQQMIEQYHHPQHFEQQFSQHMMQQPQQMESSAKETRSTSVHQNFVQQTHSGALPSVQSPPLKILHPIKPFDFRPSSGDENAFVEGNNSLRPDPNPSTDRPAIRACRRIEKGLKASLSQHILGGVPAELGEFPHMVALGYSRIGGGDRPPYDVRCGGTLIDKRFVLTAAHCVSERENVPAIVRLGLVNLTDPTQISAAIEVRIKETHIHDEYHIPRTYNDIAVLELESDVEYSEYIYPVCLYTNETDPNTKIKLWVTGWGTINTTTRTFSDILLKAPLHTAPLLNCNKRFKDYGLNRKIPEGIIRTQFCAEDKNQIIDACQGDSGGPLNMILDESYKKYRLVGIVSSGFGCASSTPGLYTRVAAFLEFIEKIVWPNGGD